MLVLESRAIFRTAHEITSFFSVGSLLAFAVNQRTLCSVKIARDYRDSAKCHYVQQPFNWLNTIIYLFFIYLIHSRFFRWLSYSTHHSLSPCILGCTNSAFLFTEPSLYNDHVFMPFDTHNSNISRWSSPSLSNVLSLYFFFIFIRTLSHAVYCHFNYV